MSYSPRHLARLAGFTLLQGEGDEVRISDEFPTFLFVGPGADADVLATVSVRRALRKNRIRSEAAVKQRVEAHGYRYRPENGAALAV